MNVSKTYGLSKAETDGKWFDLGGARVRLRSARYEPYVDRLAELFEEHAEAMRTGKLAGSTKHQVSCRALADELVLEWEGVTDGDADAPVPFSKENAYRLMAKHRGFGNAIYRLVNGLATFQDGLDQAGIENAKKD